MDDSHALPLIVMVDDELEVLRALKRCLRTVDARIETFNSAVEALQYIEQNHPQLVISDQRMPLLTGTELVAQLKHKGVDCPCILLSAYQDFDEISKAFNSGSLARFLDKPWDSDELIFLVRKLLQRDVPKIEHVRADNSAFHGMISADKRMHGVFEMISTAASASVPIFIAGETGTGKELAANACHLESFRHAQPFVAFNCANFSDQLMESQLFGHKRGAFTGAVSDQQGLFAAAGKGSLFLDEVTTLDASLQAKLLRVIQEREFTPLGSSVAQPLEAALITASSTTLSEAVGRGVFREDLFYRLNVITLNLPALRDRGEDSVHLAQHFLRTFADRYAKRFKGFSPAALSLLVSYSWPGNVRQLENVIHSTVIMQDTEQVDEQMLERTLSQYEISARGGAQIPSPDNPLAENVECTVSHSPNTAGANMTLAQIEREAIQQAIARCDGNVVKAAEQLDVSASTLYRKLSRWESGKHCSQ